MTDLYKINTIIVKIFDLNLIITRFAKLFGLLSYAALLAGCEGTHIYRQADSDLAVKAEASFKNAKLSQTLSEERKQLDVMSERELAVVRRQTLALRDAWLIEIAGRSSAAIAADDLSVQIEKRLDKLTGKVTPDALITSFLGIDGKQIQKERAAALYRVQSSPNDPALPAIPGTPEEIDAIRAKLSSPNLVAVFNQYILRSQELEALQTQYQKTIARDPQSALGQLTASLDEIDLCRKKLSDELALRKKAFDNAKKAYGDALAKGATNEITHTAQQLTNALSKLDLSKADPIFDKLEAIGFGDLGLEGTITKLEVQKGAALKIADLLINDKTATNTLKQTTRQPAMLFLTGLLPSFREQVGNQILHPSISHLLLQQQQLSAELEASSRRMNHAKQRYDLLQEKRTFVLEEITLLATAHKGASALKNSLSKAGSQVSQALLPAALAKLGPDESENGYTALVNYSLAWTLGRVGEEVADYKIIADRQQAALDDSEVALLEWENLIGIPLSQLVALHGSGIKPEMIANLISAAGVSAAIGLK